MLVLLAERADTRNYTGERLPVRRVGGQLAGIERVPCRFSLFLPSDLRIGPGSDATVSED